MDTPDTAGTSRAITAQLESSLSRDVPLLPKAFLRVLAKVLVGIFVMLWKYAGWIFLQLFPRDATLQESTINGKLRRPLQEWGNLLGFRDPLAGSPATLDVTVTVTNQTGSLAAGALLTLGELVFRVVAPVALNAAQVTARVQCTTVGAASNLDVGVVLAFANAPNVAPTAVVAAQVVAGVDPETEADYRAAVLAHAQEAPQGGAYEHYVEWGSEVAGVKSIEPWDAKPVGRPGEVDVFVEVDTGVDPDGIADSGHLTAVFNSIQLNGASGKATRRPVGAAVNVLAIGRLGFEVQISGLALPDGIDPTDTKQAIHDGLDEYFRSLAPFIVGLSELPRLDRITGAALAGIVDTVVSAAGGTVNKVEFFQSGIDLTHIGYLLTRGQRAKLSGNISTNPSYV